LATNFLGSNNTITSTVGYYNGARNIVGNGNEIAVGGLGSNLNLGLNVFGNGNHLFSGPRNVNAIVNGGASGNTIHAGGPGDVNARFNFFGQTNTVVAGPGPLALAGSVFKDNQVVTKSNAGIAINNVRIGGTAVQGGQGSTVPTANAGSKKKAGNATDNSRRCP
jgi:hypothetical protein